MHVRISEVKRLNKARGKKRGLGSVDGAITLARQRDIERPMRGVRGGTAKSFLAASVLANALGGGGGGVGGETLTVSSNVLDTRGASVCVLLDLLHIRCHNTHSGDIFEKWVPQNFPD